MRIGLPTAASWLVAASLEGMAVATASEENTWVNFYRNDFLGDGTSKAIFYPLSNSSRMFQWDSKEFAVTGVQLCAALENYARVLATYLPSTTAGTTVSIATAGTTTPTATAATTSTSTSQGPGTTSPIHFRRRAMADGVPTDYNFNSNGLYGSLTANMTSIAANSLIVANNNLTLYFVAFWNNSEGNPAWSYSQPFMVTNSAPGTADWVSMNNTFTGSTLPYLAEFLGDSSPGATASGASDATATATSSTTAATGSGSGLSTGAIAGIAIAAGVVVLSLFTGILWWTLRRRHQRDRQVGLSYGDPRNRTQDLVAEKEAAAATALAHPSYSDEALTSRDDSSRGGGDSENQQGPLVLPRRLSSPPPQLRQTQLRLQPIDTLLSHVSSPGAVPGVGVDVADQDHDQHGYTSFSDRPIGVASGSDSPATSSAPLAGSTEREHEHEPEHEPASASASESQPPPQPQTERIATPSRVIATPLPGRGTPGSNYAHLVEDGMTEHDILRMEEEERELDAAIERARRR